MGVTSCTLLKTHSDVNDKGQFTHWAQYRVKCDQRNMTGMAVVIGAAISTPDPIPSWKASFSLLGDSDPNAFALKFSPRYQQGDDSTSIWTIDVEWMPSANPDDDWTNDLDPTLRPVLIDGDEEEVQEICEEGWNEEALTGIGRAADVFGPIVNPAGKEYDTPLMKSVRVVVKVFRKNFKDLPGNSALNQIDALAASFVDKLNNATFYGAPAGKAIVRSIKPSEELFAGGIKYRVATIRVAAYAKGWSFPMVNKGFEFFDGSGVLTQATTPDDMGDEQPIAEPINLELDGTRTPDGTVGTVTHWRTSAKVDFAGLGVGTS